MSVQPLLYDRDYGYVTAINPGKHFDWGQEFEVELSDGSILRLDRSYLGSRIYIAVTRFLRQQNEDNEVL